MNGTPRIQGKVGQCDQSSNPKEIGKWFFTVWITIMGSGEQEEFGPIGPWESESLAQDELRNACKIICEKVSKGIPGADPQSFIDMKDNKMKRWDNSDLN